jgi:hypothetical protein
VPHLIIFSILLLCGLMVSCVLIGCQPLVQPFRPDEKVIGDALTVRDAGGVVVRRIEGLPEGTEAALAEPIVAGLQRQEIPATTVASGANRRSLFLDAVVRTQPLDRERLVVEIDWRLTDADGRPAGTYVARSEVPRALWGDKWNQVFELVGERSVPGIAAMLRGPEMQPAEAPPERRIYVWQVAGAPGNGGPMLARAMGSALRAARLPVADEMGDDALVIAGSVYVSPPDKARQRVEIDWTVLDATGREIAKLSQANTIAEGALDGDWSELARLIADAAVPGVADLLRQLSARAAVPSTPSGG